MFVKSLSILVKQDCTVKYSVNGIGKTCTVNLPKNVKVVLCNHVLVERTPINSKVNIRKFPLEDYFLDVNKPTDEELMMFELDTGLDIKGIMKSIAEYCNR